MSPKTVELTGKRSKVTLVANSVSATTGKRIISFECEFPRYILPEWNTHAANSKNAASSRAIPVKKLIAKIDEEPNWYPIWTENQAGMQGNVITDNYKIKKLNESWDRAKSFALEEAAILADLNAHKQNVNRVLEPFSKTICIVTFTEYENFFKLRSHPDALPEIKEVSDAMLAMVNTYEPVELKLNDWHIPYIDQEDSDLSLENRLKVSVARCARVSYKLRDGNRSELDKDLALYDMLKQDGHMSPFGHQGKVLPSNSITQYKDYSDITANFRGYGQYRRYIELGIY